MSSCFWWVESPARTWNKQYEDSSLKCQSIKGLKSAGHGNHSFATKQNIYLKSISHVTRASSVLMEIKSLNNSNSLTHSFVIYFRLFRKLSTHAKNGNAGKRESYGMLQKEGLETINKLHVIRVLRSKYTVISVFAHCILWIVAVCFLLVSIKKQPSTVWLKFETCTSCALTLLDIFEVDSSGFPLFDKKLSRTVWYHFSRYSSAAWWQS